jgi:undecaprenyl-diphosphatase
LLNWQDPGLAFDVALHLGTLLALLVYYWREWLDMGLSLATGDVVSRRLLLLLVVASIPGAVIGLALEKQAETIFRSPLLIAAPMALLGIVLWFSDVRFPEERTIGEMTVVDAILIGLSQALAIVPGVSRSGATITAARLLGVERRDAANFSFLMATPIIAGAGMVEARKIAIAGLNAQIGWGFAAAAIFGLLAIASLIRFVRRRTYVLFAWYRLAAAALVIAIVIARA